jgi:hypothetical protein
MPNTSCEGKLTEIDNQNTRRLLPLEDWKFLLVMGKPARECAHATQPVAKKQSENKKKLPLAVAKKKGRLLGLPFSNWQGFKRLS